MKRSSEFRVKDILRAIDRIEDYVGGLRTSTFVHNYLIQDGVLRQLGIIGEATKHLNPAIIKANPDIKWSGIIAMRNIISHDYTQVDLPLVFETVKKDLPKLKKVLESIKK